MSQAKTQTVFASAERTATPTAVELDVDTADYLTLVIDVSATDATPSVVFDIDFVDPLSGNSVTILASAAITSTGTTILHVGPGLSASANAVAETILPTRVSITATHADTDSITYSVVAILR
jgi:hypothetical protein